MTQNSLTFGILTLQIILPVLLAGVTHLIAIKYDPWPWLKKPLDAGLTYKGKRLFGNNKTWRGLLIMAIATSFFYIAILQDASVQNLLIGASLGIGYILGELPNSFYKRQKSIASGAVPRGTRGLWYYFLDQIDSIIGVTIVAAIALKLDLYSCVFLLTAGTAIHILVDCIAIETGFKKRASPHKRFIFSQTFVFICCTFIFKWMNKTEVYGAENLEHIDPNAPVIMAANHRNRYDSYLIAGAMPWKYFKKMLPKRYMTYHRYMVQPGMGQFLHFCGAYTTAMKQNAKTYERSKRMLARGESILMYPEGRMTEPVEGPKKAKVGIMWIARGIDNIQIVPIKIESNIRIPLPAIFKGGQRFAVTFGKPYTPKDIEEDLQPHANELMERIYALKHDSAYAPSLHYGATADKDITTRHI